MLADIFKTKEPKEDNSADLGEIIMSWSFPEYPREKREKRLLIILGVIFGAILLYAILTKNFLFVIILVLFAFIVFIRELQEPMEISIGFTERGIILGESFTPYTQLRRFWILYDPPHLKTLYLSSKNKWKSNISIAMTDQDPVAIRNFLLKFIDEDLTQDEEPFSEILSKIFRL